MEFIDTRAGMDFANIKQKAEDTNDSSLTGAN